MRWIVGYCGIFGLVFWVVELKLGRDEVLKWEFVGFDGVCFS